MFINELFPQDTLLESSKIESEIQWLENRIKEYTAQIKGQPNHAQVDYLESLESSLRSAKERLAASKTLGGKVKKFFGMSR